MRKRSKILRDVDNAKAQLQGYYDELEEIREKCPHPKDFLEVHEGDKYDNGPGVERYEYTLMTVTCQLCEKTSYHEFVSDKSFMGVSNRPSPSSVIQENDLQV